MTDYSDITQYGQDTITQILPSQVQYEFLLASAQKFFFADRQEETLEHILRRSLCQQKGATGVLVPALRRRRWDSWGPRVGSKGHVTIMTLPKDFRLAS